MEIDASIKNHYEHLIEEFGALPTFYDIKYLNPNNNPGIHKCVPGLTPKQATERSLEWLCYSTDYTPEDFTVNDVFETESKDMPLELIEWLKNQ